MNTTLKIAIPIIILLFLLNGCFSYTELSYEYDSEYNSEPITEIIIIEDVPPPIIIIDPGVQYEEEPKTKLRTGGERNNEASNRTGRTSYTERSVQMDYSGRSDFRKEIGSKTEKRAGKNR